MEVNEKPSELDTKESVTFKVTWKQPEYANESNFVDVVLGPSGGANNDLFEIYSDGDKIKESSPFSVYRLDKIQHSSSVSFEKEIELFKMTYQFIFQIEDVNGEVYSSLSDDYQQTKLVSGRTVNFVELDEIIDSTAQGKNAFSDISESSPLVGGAKEQNKNKGQRKGCGCAPKSCSVL